MCPENNDTDSLLTQAATLSNAKKYQRAEEIYHQVLAQDSANESALRGICRLLYQTNKNQELLQACKNYINNNPESALAYSFLGLAYLSLNDISKAADNLQKSLTLDPSNANVNLKLAALRYQQNNINDTIACLHNAIKYNPSNAQAHYELGVIFKQLGNTKKSLEYLKKTIHLDPNNFFAYHNIGALYSITVDHQQAYEHFKKAIEINPEHTISLSALSDSCERTHRLDEAEHYIKRALDLDPDDPMALRVSATILRRQNKPQEALALLSQTKIPDSPKLAEGFHLELGKLYDLNGEYDKAYYHFLTGNNILRTFEKPHLANKEIYLKTIDNLKIRFTNDWLQSWKRNNNDKSYTPVFLVGFPRSGTTLLDQILDSHPNIVVLEEKPILSSIQNLIEARHGHYPDILSELTASNIKELRNEYLSIARQYYSFTDKETFIDKLPLNITQTGLIYRLFPEAKFILALRHPCDSCLSCFMQLFSHNDAMANFYTLHDSANLYAKIMDLWQHYTELLPLNIHQIKYENLVDNLEAEIRPLLAFLELQWDDRVLSYNRHATKRKDISTTPSYNQVTQAIYKTAKYRWLNYRQHMEAELPILEPYIKLFGYEIP